MAATINITVPDADELLTLFGNGALIRWEYGTDNVSFTEGGTVALVDDTFAYSVYSLLVGPTSWVRLRYSKASPALSTDYSGYGASFQPGGSGAYVTPTLLKARGTIDDAIDDATIQGICDEVNRELHSRIGVFIGPSSDTSRVYNGDAAVRNQTRLWIPGGIRTLTAVSVGWVSNDSTSVAGTITGFDLGPDTYTLAPGEPYQWVDIIRWGGSSSSIYLWPPYTKNVLLTGSFGYAAIPADLQGVATMMATRKLQSRNTGGGQTAPLSFGDGQIYPFITKPEMLVVDRYADEIRARAA